MEHRIEIRFRIDDAKTGEDNQDIIYISVNGPELRIIDISRNANQLLHGDKYACNMAVQDILNQLLLKELNRFAGSKSFITVNEAEKEFSKKERD